jgi:hypothetical protein
MRRYFKKSNLLYLALGLMLSVLPIAVSCGDSPVGKKPVGHAGEGGQGGAGSNPIIDAPEAESAGELPLDEPLSDVVEFSGLTVGLHTESGVSLLDMSNPREPVVLSRLVTTGPPVAVAFDALKRVLFIVTQSGDLRAYFVANPSSPSQAAQSTVSEPDETDSIRGLARVGSSLYVLGKSHFLPVSVTTLSGGILSFSARNPVAIDDDASLVAAGGGRLYLSFASGTVQVWDVDDIDSPAELNDADFGAEIVGWVVRGNRLFLALRGVGLRVVKLGDSGRPATIYEESTLTDIVSTKRSGNLVLISLERGLLVAIDLSDVNAPRPLVTKSGPKPVWATAVEGNLLLGTGSTLSVFGVPPFVNATVPAAMKQAFPRYGRLPIKLSKRVDRQSFDDAVKKLRCNGDEIAGQFVLDPTDSVLTFLADDALPADADCDVELSGVTDALGLVISKTDLALAFKTSSDAPASVESPKASYPHRADGAFSDWEPGATDYEYQGVQAAQGMYSRFYANHDGERLWMLNDWFYNGDAIEPDCYNQFGVYTGGGTEFWEIRAYGDQHIEVRLNGSVLAADDERVLGGYSLVATPNDSTPHTVYEIGVETAPGGWGVQLHDPGPTYGCDRLETDPMTYAGQSSDTMSTVDPTIVPTVPAVPDVDFGALVGAAPTLGITSSDDASNWTVYYLEISGGSRFTTALFSSWVYGKYLSIPEGLLKRGSTFTFRVTAYNLAGTTVGEPKSFTVPAGDVAAPVLEAFSPKSVVQGTAQAITITGTGFVDGAQAFWDGAAVGTTYMDSTTVVAMLSSQLTRTVGSHSLVVRNAPNDATTESNELTVPVIADDTGTGGEGGGPSTGGTGGTGGGGSCVHKECVVGARLSNTCSECAAAVCAVMGSESCCTDSWSSDCVTRALSFPSLCPTCTGGGGAGGGGAGGRGGAGAGGMSGGGAGGSGGSGGALACFTGGTTPTMNQQGSCSDPLVFNLAGGQPGGQTLVHQHFSGDSFTFAGTSCGWQNIRNDIYQIQISDTAQGFEVSVDASQNANVRIAVLEDNSCTQPANLCVDNAATGRCEVARFYKTTHFFGMQPYFVVGYAGGTVNEPLTVRVRTF